MFTQDVEGTLQFVASPRFQGLLRKGPKGNMLPLVGAVMENTLSEIAETIPESEISANLIVPIRESSEIYVGQITLVPTETNLPYESAEFLEGVTEKDTVESVFDNRRENYHAWIELNPLKRMVFGIFSVYDMNN